MSTQPLALIIEDNEDQNLVFTTALTKAGYATESIYDGVTALNRLSKAGPAMIILDLHVPGINGGWLLREIRKDPRTTNSCVIIVTADADFAEKLRSQADFVLIKPVSFLELTKLANSLLDQLKTP